MQAVRLITLCAVLALFAGGCHMAETSPGSRHAGAQGNAAAAPVLKTEAEGGGSAGCGQAPPVTPGQTRSFTVNAGGLKRTFRLHIPPGYDENVPASLVLNFHGYTGNALENERNSEMSDHADANGYLVVYPQATEFDGGEGLGRITSWNDRACNASPGPEGPICAPDAFVYPAPPECGVREDDCNWCTCHDDVAFVRVMLDRLEQMLCVDRGGVYATGISNGGMVVHRLGCELADRFAAVAPVAGVLANGFNCAPATRLSLMQIHGRQDTTVPYNGVKSSGGYFYESVKEVADLWGSGVSQQCDAALTPYPTTADGEKGWQCRRHAHCATGAEVVTCLWDGGHEWPGRVGNEPFGNDAMWAFFQQNHR